MKRSLPVVGVLVTCAALFVGALPTHSAPGDPNSTNNNSEKLRRAVTVDGILEHEEALQAIAGPGGNRISGAPGTTGRPTTWRRVQQRLVST